MSSSSHVLGIIELLDMVLQYGDWKDLFRQQRVNKKGQVVIQTSTTLQDKMLFRSAAHNHVDRKDTITEWNPFMAAFGYPPTANNDYKGCEINAHALRNLGLACTNATWKNMRVTKPALQKMVIYRFNLGLTAPVDTL